MLQDATEDILFIAPKVFYIASVLTKSAVAKKSRAKIESQKKL